MNKAVLISILDKLKEGRITKKQVAKELGISVRQLKRLVKQNKREGGSEVIDENPGKIEYRGINLLVMVSLGGNAFLFFMFLLSRHYSPVLMFLHIMSLAVLWSFVFYRLRLLRHVSVRWKEFLLIGAFVVASLCVGLYRVEEITPGMYGDEVEVATHSLALVKQPEWLPFVGNYSHPTPLLYLTAFSIQTFGHTMTAIRLPSIVFGALTVGAFYIFLRLFFPIPIAGFGAVLMIFQYTQVAQERLAYESPASLFCQTVSAVFFVLYHKTKDWMYLIGLALAIGAGLYTYLNFRAFAIVMLLLAGYLILRTNWKHHWNEAAVLAITLFIATMPLFSYSVIDPKGFWLRPSEISIFSRHYSLLEFLKELGGNTYRTILLPFIGIPGQHPPLMGDPNLGKNPSGFTIFDPLTTILAGMGFVYLFRKNRGMFWIGILMFVPPLISDIFSTEIVPEFHYYGVGHPNALRVSGLIGLILFTATVGLNWIFSLWKSHKFKTGLLTVSVLVLLISMINWALYFDQLNISRANYNYNYITNAADVQQMISYLNLSKAEKINLTNSLDTERVHFFLNPTKKISNFQMRSTADTIREIMNNEATAIDFNGRNVSVVNELLARVNLDEIGYRMIEFGNTTNIHQPNIVVFIKKEISL
jgi:hypothetical protein